ncbi:hypothetical protein GYMLUDRAFT_110769, partial [Collybiopsis luxurians FD-317 M1]
KTKYFDLHIQHQSIEAQLAQTTTEKDKLSQEMSSLQSETELTQQALSVLQEKFSNAASELMTNTRYLQTVQNEAKIANRR